MYTNTSKDPRSIRSRESFLKAFEELLAVHPFERITIAMIAGKAGYARHTFYNHFESREDLLNSLVDGIMGEFFELAANWGAMSHDPDADQKLGLKFFSLWKENCQVVKRLTSLDADALIIERLRESFNRAYLEHDIGEVSGACPELAHYITSLNSYAFAGVLMQWFKDDMRYPPELVGQFLTHFLGINAKKAAIQKFNAAFCPARS